MQKAYYSLILTISLIGCTSRINHGEPCDSWLPSMYIDIDNNDLDSILSNQQYKATAKMLLIDTTGDTIYDEQLSHIKGRGNNSWNGDKRPFTIKLHRKSQLLGLQKGKTFCLLSNGTDESHIRNAIAFELAPIFGLQAPKYEYIRLYINEEYKGLYMMTNKIDVGKHGVDIVDLDKMNKNANINPMYNYRTYENGCYKGGTASQNEYELGSSKGVLMENNPDDISGGYLINVGHNGYYKSISGFVSPYMQYVRIESPKYASSDEVKYIFDYYNKVSECIAKLKEEDTLDELEDYIDIDSFVRYYILNEILFNIDMAQNSFYMYKDAGMDKLHAGPVWDFDLSLNNTAAIGEHLMYSEVWMDKIDTIEAYLPFGSPIWYQHLWRNKQFRQIVKTMYLEKISPALHAWLENDVLIKLVTKIKVTAEQEQIKGCDNQIATFDEAINKAITFLWKRVDFFDWYYSAMQKDIVCISIVTKGQEQACRRYYMPKGSKVELPQYIYVGGFWNNSPNAIWFYEDTDSIIQEGDIVNNDIKIERRLLQPKQSEIFSRKVKKFIVSVAKLIWSK